MWWRNDSLQSKMMPRNFVSSTTEIGVPFNKAEVLDVVYVIYRNVCNADCFGRREFKSILNPLVSAQWDSLLWHCCKCRSITWMFWAVKIRKSSSHKEHLTPREIAFIVELILRSNKGTALWYTHFLIEEVRNASTKSYVKLSIVQ